MSTPSVGHAPQAEQFSNVQSGVVRPSSAKRRSRASHRVDTPVEICSHGMTRVVGYAVCAMAAGSMPTSSAASRQAASAKHSVHASKRAPRRQAASTHAAASRPARLITASTKLVAGSCQCTSTARYFTELRSSCTRRSASSGGICPSHWNGVCAFGTNSAHDTLMRKDPRCSGGVAAFMRS